MCRLELAEIFGNGMVLQRDKKIAVFGCSEAEAKIGVCLLDETGKILSSGECQADKSGNWIVNMPGLGVNRNLSMLVKCEASGETIKIENISLGDVWIAGGQSNMEFFNKYDADWNETKEEIINLDIHMYNTPQRAFEGHNTHNGRGREGYGTWLCDKESGYENFSAPAYNFAKKVQPEIGVPIGLIGCNWGGSTAVAWLDKKELENDTLDYYLKEYDESVASMTKEEMAEASRIGWEIEDNPDNYIRFEECLYRTDRKWQEDFLKSKADAPATPLGPYNMNRPGGLYENMLKKLIPYSVKGVLWYQGESDTGNRADTYDTLFSTMINAWRREWNDEIPFIFVQLAPFGVWLDCVNDGYHTVRQKQLKVADTLKDVYMSSIMDIGSYYDIHPKQKKEVGRRLALLALGHVYNQNILCDNPRIANKKLVNGNIALEFTNADGLHIANEENSITITINKIEVTPSNLLIQDDMLIIEMPSPVSESDDVHISLGWDNYAVINIKNKAGLPIIPFEI